MLNGQVLEADPKVVKIRNASGVRQNLGWIRFNADEVKEVEAARAADILRYPQFVEDKPERPARIRRESRGVPLPSRSDALLTEVRKALQPDPPSPQWIADLNRDVFPCQTDEFDPIAKAKTTFGIVFRLVDCSEMNGGTRFILRLAGYLGARGHQVRVSCLRTPIKPDDLPGLPVTLTEDLAVPDGQFVCGTYWTTIREVAAAPLGGKRLALLQAPEPSWPEAANYRKQAEAAFTDPSVKYFAIGPSLAKVCKREYGTEVYCTLPGSCIDTVAFGPRINDHKVRDRVCFIYRRAPWKGLDTVLQVVEAYKQRWPQTTVAAMGFSRWAHPLVDDYRMDPPTEDIPDFYSGSDFYLTAGMYEGSPLPPLEAMACGCIPVSTESGVRDYLRDDENGLLLNPKDPEGAAERMADVMADETRRQTLKRNGLLTARERPMVRLFAVFEKAVLGL